MPQLFSTYGCNIYYVASSSLLGDVSHSSVVSPVGHSLLDRGVYENPNSLSRFIVDEKTSQGNLAPVPGLSPHDLPVLVANAMGALQRVHSVRGQRVLGVRYILVS